MIRCGYCDGRFFKLLEARCMPETSRNVLTVFYKKRCKRCKMKGYFRRELPGGETETMSGADWVAHVKTTMPVQDTGRLRIFASEYSKRVCRGADCNVNYVTGGRHAESA